MGVFRKTPRTKFRLQIEAFAEQVSKMNPEEFLRALSKLRRMQLLAADELKYIFSKLSNKQKHEIFKHLKEHCARCGACQEKKK